MKTLPMIAGMAAMLMVTASPARSQTPPPLAEAAPPPAATDAPTASRLALARQVMAATGAQRSIQGMLGNMASQLTASVGKTLPAAKQEKIRLVAEAADHALARLAPQIIQDMTEAYATTFSEKELGDMLAFYESPTGRSMTAKTPLLMQSIVGHVAKLIPQMQRQMAEEICSRTTCTAAEKSAYLGEARATP